MKATKDAMNMLHATLADTLAAAINEGVTVIDKEGNPVKATCPASILSVARQFLKDNQIELGKGEADQSSIARAMKEMSDLPMDDEVPKEYRN